MLGRSPTTVCKPLSQTGITSFTRASNGTMPSPRNVVLGVSNTQWNLATQIICLAKGEHTGMEGHAIRDTNRKRTVAIQRVEESHAISSAIKARLSFVGS